MTDQKKPDEKPEEKKPTGGPIPTSAMYIGICQSRAQASSSRLQRTIVYMAANAALLGWTINLTSYGLHGRYWIAPMLIAFIGACMNFMWRRQVRRENRFIDFYTGCLGAMETRFGTETGVIIFSANDFPSAVRAREISFRGGVKIMSVVAQILWGATCAGSLGWVIYTLGRGTF